MWIAFRLYLWLIEHNPFVLKHHQVLVVNCFQIVSLTYWTQLFNRQMPYSSVVNCFQIVSLTYWTQLPLKTLRYEPCCELLSDCIFDLLNTTKCAITVLRFMLWIAFRLYLWLIEHNAIISILFRNLVVNCFQIVSLTYWTQQRVVAKMEEACCELLSDCIFDLLNTTYHRSKNCITIR